MKAVVRIEIEDDGEHWHRKIWVLGIPVYHRHDFMKGHTPQRTVGFRVMPYAPVGVGEDDGREDLSNRK